MEMEKEKRVYKLGLIGTDYVDIVIATSPERACEIARFCFPLTQVIDITDDTLTLTDDDLERLKFKSDDPRDKGC